MERCCCGGFHRSDDLGGRRKEGGERKKEERGRRSNRLWQMVLLTTSQVVEDNAGVYCKVDDGVADAGMADGVSGKADGVVRQRRASVGRSSVGQSVSQGQRYRRR
jgi:hypothetical protein